MKTAYIQELQQIAERNGGFLRPHDVVEFAKDPETALHRHFTWDDTEAAFQYRLEQARRIVRFSVTVMPGQTQKVKVFVSLKKDRNSQGGYRSLVSVMSNDEQRETLLIESQEEMEVFIKKYNVLQELSGVFAEMEKVLGKYPKKERPAKKAMPGLTRAGEEQRVAAG